jgi:hypothetical protein
MVYNTQNFWVFGLFPSSGTLENRKHDISETGSVSVLRFLYSFAIYIKQISFCNGFVTKYHIWMYELRHFEH